MVKAPGPPFKRTFCYLVHDITQYVDTNNLTWSKENITNTASNIWASVPGIKDHYKKSKGRRIGPGLPNPNPVPIRPYTRGDAEASKRANRVPARLVKAVEDNNAAEGEHAAEGDHAAGEQSRIAEASTATNGRHRDQRPYSFWPDLPWPDDDPDLNVPTIEHPTNEHIEVTRWLDGVPERSSDTEDHMWQGVEFLGAGGYGIVGLWVKTDENNNILDTMVIKDTRNIGIVQWRDPKNWRGGLPQEVRIHELVESRRTADPEGCRHLIHYLGHRLFMRQMRYRLYLSFCSSGSLWDALSRRPKTDGLIPEAYIWYVIKALASAILILQQRSTTDGEIDVWNPIQHLDVQPMNVFLDVRNYGTPGESDQSDEEVAENLDDAGPSTKSKGKEKAEPAPEIPPKAKKARRTSKARLEPILGDFGLAFFSPPQDNCPLKDNPFDYIFNNDHPRYTPEQQFQDPNHTIRLDESTDVWGIGQVAWSMIINQQNNCGAAREDIIDHRPDAPYGEDFPLGYRHAPGNKSKLTPEMTLSGQRFPNSKGYSEELKRLVRQCLEWHSNNRPLAEEIFDEATFWLNNNAPKVTRLSRIEHLGLDLPDYSEYEKGQPFRGRKRKRSMDEKDPALGQESSSPAVSIY